MEQLRHPNTIEYKGCYLKDNTAWVRPDSLSPTPSLNIGVTAVYIGHRSHLTAAFTLLTLSILLSIFFLLFIIYPSYPVSFSSYLIQLQKKKLMHLSLLLVFAFVSFAIILINVIL